jgi:uncharacterized membrane protein YhhN
LLPGAAYVALAVADSVAAGRTSAAARRARYVLKPALMPVLATAFLDATRGRDTTLRNGTVAAQGLSWGGDVAHLGSSERAFLAGVGSFFGAHVAYLAAFVSVRGEKEDVDRAGLRVAGGLWLTTAPLMSLAAGRKDPTLRGPVAVYATILSAMFASSRMLDPDLPPAARRTLRTGTALFLVSDTALAVQQFLLPEPVPALESFVMATYTSAQGLIAAGVAGATQAHRPPLVPRTPAG